MTRGWWLLLLLTFFTASPESRAAGGQGHASPEGLTPLPHSLSAYEAAEQAQGIDSISGILLHRIAEDPFNLFATLIFLAAVVHTFLAGYFQKLAHRIEEQHRLQLIEERRRNGQEAILDPKRDNSISATVCHFLGEVEAIFGIWCVPLVLTMLYFYDWGSVTRYIDTEVNYTEPMFVVVIMAMAATRPVLKFSEHVLGTLAGLGGRSPRAWWYSILIVAPLLGSFITEPAAMTIAAMLLAKTFFSLEPSWKFKYGTLGLLFVNVSVGGTLTHFAAPPVLMLAGTWNWDMAFMFTHFGWKACLGILCATSLYGFFFRKEFAQLADKAKSRQADLMESAEEPIPAWITLMVLIFMGWTVFNLHNPPLFIAGFLFFMAFVEATASYQDEVKIKGPILVGFFLAALVTHGGLQSWWIAPILGNLGELPLFTGATLMTAFNDNAAITFLASQVPAFDPSAGAGAVAKQYAVVAGAVTGGGLTVIANAPNPAGQSLLSRFFPGGIKPQHLLLGSLPPTLLMALVFLAFR